MTISARRRAVIRQSLAPVPAVVLACGCGGSRRPIRHIADPDGLRGAVSLGSRFGGIPQVGDALGSPRSSYTLFEFIEPQCLSLRGLTAMFFRQSSRIRSTRAPTNRAPSDRVHWSRVGPRNVPRLQPVCRTGCGSLRICFTETRNTSSRNIRAM
jgi:hypothetical protein